MRGALGTLAGCAAIGIGGPAPAQAAVRITSPARSDGPAPIALMRYRDRQGADAAGPFVTSRRALTVSAIGQGRVRFTLAAAGRLRRVIVDRRAPFRARFDRLAPDEYTLRAEQLSPAGAVVARDALLRVGVGDVIVTVGDSIVQRTFVGGQAALAAAEPASILAAQRDFGGVVAAGLPYPVFVVNEGYGEITSDGYVHKVIADRAWQARIRALRPNRAFVMLGTNDASSGRTGPQLAASLGTIVDALEARGIGPKSILLSPPPWATKPFLGDEVAALQASVRAFVQRRGLVAGPDLYGLFRRHPERVSDDGIHPDTAGLLTMGRRWARAFLDSLG